jgi:hypothetical protein
MVDNYRQQASSLSRGSDAGDRGGAPRRVGLWPRRRGSGEARRRGSYAGVNGS